jgi:hypothetical protein
MAFFFILRHCIFQYRHYGKAISSAHYPKRNEKERQKTISFSWLTLLWYFPLLAWYNLLPLPQFNYFIININIYSNSPFCTHFCHFHNGKSSIVHNWFYFCQRRKKRKKQKCCSFWTFPLSICSSLFRIYICFD